MPLALAFWLVMFLWIFLGSYFRWDATSPAPWRVLIPDFFPFLALCLLGYHVFGAALK